MQATEDSIRSSGRELTLVAAYNATSRHTEIDGEGIQLALDFELLAIENGADPSWDREQLIKHQRSLAGRRGGLATLARYGKPYYRALARTRWGKTPETLLPEIRRILRAQDARPTRLPNKGEQGPTQKEMAA